MALFNFIIDDAAKRKRDQMEQLRQSLFKPGVQLQRTLEQQGPMQPGMERAQITAPEIDASGQPVWQTPPSGLFAKNPQLGEAAAASVGTGLESQIMPYAMKTQYPDLAAASAKSYQPQLVRDAQGNLKQVMPVFDPKTGQASYKLMDTPEGFEITQETPEQKRMRDIKAEGEKEKEKLIAQSRLLPGIRSAIKQAEVEAQAKGEALTGYNRAKAALPGLQQVTTKLKQLADIGTYTLGGKAFNLMAKELGFGATKGATARASMISIVDNQVLPLLKATFGGSFSVQEGDSLRSSLLDANATPGEKKATLDAFIEQKMRNLQTSERELGIKPEQQPAGQQPPSAPTTPKRIRFDAQGNMIQ
jgi:hypothetical protein